ncbi:MAG: glycosyltransferase, partial [Pyrinomonadaceae bacterium]|nr:glycosyltransferase [Sphingobacteriaceae bacterium]
MKVLYDHQIFSMQEYGGISRYFATLNDQLNNFSDTKSSISILHSKNHYLKEPNKFWHGMLGNTFLNKQSRNYKWNKWFSRYTIRQNKFDILHPTYYHPYFLKVLKKPFVITVHDMIHELYPEFFDKNDIFTAYKRIVIPRADHIIAVSNSTKNDLQGLFNIPDEKITVIHHGFISPIIDTSASTLPIVLNEKYILFVGGRSAYKNFNRFILAIAPLMVNSNINL